MSNTYHIGNITVHLQNFITDLILAETICLSEKIYVTKRSSRAKDEYNSSAGHSEVTIY